MTVLSDPTIGLVPALVAGAAAHLSFPGSARPGRMVPGRRAAVVTMVLIAGVAIGSLDGARLVLGLVAIAVVAAGAREARRRAAVAAADRRADRVLAFCDGLVADLRAGQPPVVALDAAAVEWQEVRPLAAAARMGADVPAALRVVAEQPGASGLRVVAAAWQVAHRSGAGLAAALATVADEVRAERATSRVVATEMAAATATARLLAALPVAVLLLGGGLGGDPLGFLLDTPPGLVCLCAGLALEYAGLRWLSRIADRVTDRVTGR